MSKDKAPVTPAVRKPRVVAQLLQARLVEAGIARDG